MRIAVCLAALTLLAASARAGEHPAEPFRKSALAATIALATDEARVVDGRVLDVAFVGDERVLVLLEDAVVLYRLQPRRPLALVDRMPLARTSVARAPAGLIAVAPAEQAAWVATNQAEGAVLVSVEGDRVAESGRAAVLPWPQSARGVAYRAGTNALEAEVPGLGPGPHLRLAAGVPNVAVAPDGTLGIAGSGWTETRVGSAAAALWPGMLLASGVDPPGPRDEVAVLRLGAGGAVERGGTLGVAGAVTALAARVRDDGAAIVIAAREDGVDRLMVAEARRAR